MEERDKEEKITVVAEAKTTRGLQSPKYFSGKFCKFSV